MNIRFDRIDIENFRSIQRANICLSNQGTVIVKGINEYEDKATSNGSGKSSVFEAIIFALFEETSAGEKDVANRIINNGYSVTLYFSIDGDNYVISRTSSGSKSTVIIHKNDIDISARNKTDTNKLILEILGINKSIFLDSIFLSQNANTNLASLTPTARKERLEILTNTDYTINKFKEELKQLQVQYEANCIQAQMEITKLHGKVESLNKQEIDLNKKIDDINRENERLLGLGNINDIEAEINSTESNLESVKQLLIDYDNKISLIDDEIVKIRNEEDEINKKLLEYEKENSIIQQQYNEHSSNISQQHTMINMKNQSIAKNEKSIENIKNSDKCPTCGRKYEDINEEHIQATIAEFQVEINKLLDEIEEHKGIILDEQSKQEDLKVNQMSLSDAMGDIQQKLNDIKVRVAEQNNIKSQLNKDKMLQQQTQNTLQNSLTSLRIRKDEILKSQKVSTEEFTKMIEDIHKQLIAIAEEQAKYQEEYNKNNSYIDVIKSCIQMVTKEFRTYLLQNSIQYLNKLLDMYSKSLFSNSRDIIMISGDDAKLDIKLGDASYESLSGGERTRVNIALLLAQKSLANIVGNISCNIIILDEILGYCDSQAEENVIELISKELESLESIYMVSHKEIPIGYDTQLVIVKDKDGLSRVREY